MDSDSELSAKTGEKANKKSIFQILGLVDSPPSSPSEANPGLEVGIGESETEVEDQHPETAAFDDNFPVETASKGSESYASLFYEPKVVITSPGYTTPTTPEYPLERKRSSLSTAAIVTTSGDFKNLSTKSTGSPIPAALDSSQYQDYISVDDPEIKPVLDEHLIEKSSNDKAGPSSVSSIEVVSVTAAMDPADGVETFGDSGRSQNLEEPSAQTELHVIPVEEKPKLLSRHLMAAELSSNVKQQRELELTPKSRSLTGGSIDNISIRPITDIAARDYRPAGISSSKTRSTFQNTVKSATEAVNFMAPEPNPNGSKSAEYLAQTAASESPETITSGQTSSIADQDQENSSQKPTVVPALGPYHKRHEDCSDTSVRGSPVGLDEVLLSPEPLARTSVQLSPIVSQGLDDFDISNTSVKSISDTPLPQVWEKEVLKRTEFNLTSEENKELSTGKDVVAGQQSPARPLKPTVGTIANAVTEASVAQQEPLDESGEVVKNASERDMVVIVVVPIDKDVPGAKNTEAAIAENLDHQTEPIAEPKKVPQWMDKVSAWLKKGTRTQEVGGKDADRKPSAIDTPNASLASPPSDLSPVELNSGVGSQNIDLEAQVPPKKGSKKQMDPMKVRLIVAIGIVTVLMTGTLIMMFSTGMLY